MGLNVATELAAADSVYHRIWGMEQLNSSLRISPQNLEVRGGDLIGRSPTVCEDGGHRSRASGQGFRRVPIENRWNAGPSALPSSGNSMILEGYVIQVPATHCGALGLHSTLAHSENTIEIALQSKNQCTNFILHTMVYSTSP